jgi:methylmalonic aciduria homocystinuria type C protein
MSEHPTDESFDPESDAETFPRMPEDAPGRDVLAAVTTSCRSDGLDVATAFDVQWYREARPEGPELPSFERESALGLLIGNTRRIWPRFLEALAAEPERLDVADPLDTWVESRVRAALDAIDLEHRVVWSHRTGPDGSFIPFQAIAEAAGLAGVSPSRLAIHPEYGPWWALRAAIVFDRPGPGGEAPDVVRPCEGECDAHCMEPFERALDASDEPDAWRRWVEVREACPVGGAYRYSDEQVRYHYEKDPSHLRRAVERYCSEAD